jgi:hypothetical protein
MPRQAPGALSSAHIGVLVLAIAAAFALVTTALTLRCRLARLNARAEAQCHRLALESEPGVSSGIQKDTLTAAAISVSEKCPNESIDEDDARLAGRVADTTGAPWQDTSQSPITTHLHTAQALGLSDEARQRRSSLVRPPRAVLEARDFV